MLRALTINLNHKCKIRISFHFKSQIGRLTCRVTPKRHIRFKRTFAMLEIEIAEAERA